MGIFQHMLAHLCLIQVVVRESMLQMQCRTGDKGDIRKILLQRICRPIQIRFTLDDWELNRELIRSELVINVIHFPDEMIASASFRHVVLESSIMTE